MDEPTFGPIDVGHFDPGSTPKSKKTDWDELRSIARFENKDAELLAQVAEILGTVFTSNKKTFRPLLIDQFLALEAAARACAIEPSAQTAWIAGVISRNLQRHVDAEVYCRLRVAKDPDNWEAHAMLGEVLTEVGQQEQAVESFERALRLRPQSGHCRLSLLRAKADVDVEAELRTVEELLTKGPLANEDHVLLSACQGQLLERMQNYGAAFEAYRESNARKKRPANEDFETRFERNRELYTRKRIQFLQHAGSASELPMFIVGMPRSGTTMLERSVAMARGVHAAGELEDIGIFGSRLSKAAKKGERQLFDTVRWASAQHHDQLQRLSDFAHRVIDKMPTNFQYLGVIRSLFPRSFVIWLRRDWRDVAISCFTSNLAWPFASLEQCRTYIRAYERLMRYWIEEAGLDVYQIRYESWVCEPEGELSRLMRAGAFAAGASETEATDRYVTRTPSRFQVRQAPHQKSVGRWQRFAPHAGAILEGDDP